MSHSAQELIDIAFRGREAPDYSLLLWADDIPDLRYERIALQEFPLSNKAKRPVRNCWVWCPVGSARQLKTIVSFATLKLMENCEFFFFRVPRADSRVKISSNGLGQRGAFFSERRMRFTAKMTDEDNYLVIGENTYIGGGDLSLCRTTVTIGAGGLWSDGVLLQGTDSHGIVDIDTMEVVNNGPKHITLKRRVWLGRKSSVMKNVTIDEGAIVAAGALVVKDVPKACAVAGVPARVVRERVSWSQRRETISADERTQILRLREGLKLAAE